MNFQGQPLVIGVDVGGSKVLSAEVAPDGEVVATAVRVTPGRLVEAALVEDALGLAVAAVARGRTVTAVGVAAAGFVDAAGGRGMVAPHLAWGGGPGPAPPPRPRGPRGGP